MTRKELEHLLRAASKIVGDDQFIIIGSQAILGKYPDAPDVLTRSAEADMYAKNKPRDSDKLEAIGEVSQFNETYGYYADPVSPKTAVLPKDWKRRLINVKSAQTEGVTGLCLDPHDLAISKIAVGRDKDVEFVGHMVAHGMIARDKVLDLCTRVPSPEDDPGLASRIAARLARIFDAVDDGDG